MQIGGSTNGSGAPCPTRRWGCWSAAGPRVAPLVGGSLLLLIRNSRIAPLLPGALGFDPRMKDAHNTRAPLRSKLRYLQSGGLAQRTTLLACARAPSLAETQNCFPYHLAGGAVPEGPGGGVRSLESVAQSSAASLLVVTQRVAQAEREKNDLNPKSYTLHPTPYTLHPTPAVCQRRSKKFNRDDIS